MPLRSFRTWGWMVVFCMVMLPGSIRVARADSSDEQKPNFVFVLIDDMGWADLGCYGNVFNETPNIDRLARGGMRFTQAYAACCVCSPTRASIQTGQYPARVGITDFIPGHEHPWARLIVPPIKPALPLEEVTVAEALKSAGYATGYFGKWHLGPKDHYPFTQGYEDWFVADGGHLFPNFLYDPPIKANQGDELADILTDKALAFLEKNQHHPFMLMISHFAVHTPLQAKPSRIEKYQAKPKPSSGVNNAIYAAMIESVDQNMARLLAKLDDLKLTDRTLVIFFSDNGGLVHNMGKQEYVATSNDPLRGEKGTLYEGGIRVPMILYWPGKIRPHTQCDTPVMSIDFYPTLLELAGVPMPADQPCDGESLVGLMKQGSAVKRKNLYWHYPHYHHSTPSGAIRQGDYKLIEFFEDGKRELYNLREDIGETHDLVSQEPAVADRLHEDLEHWRQDVHALMPRSNPQYDPARSGEWAKSRTAPAK